ncbi:MAG: DNA polymerase III subunit beta [Alloprevotella sp.]|nr:DNA polymerase III subunit beta [Alloprevotella sp.]
MKFVISSALLSARLQSVGRVIAAKNTLPILNCFLFDIKGNQLTITASDNETTLRTTLELAESDSDIRFAANAKTIQDAMKEIPEQPLDFYVNDKTLEVTVEYRYGKYNFMAQAADEYPVPGQIEADAPSFEVKAPLLLDGINRTILATADDALRPVMNGIFFDIKQTDLTLVASDGHRLCCDKVLETPAAAEGSFILPKKPATLLRSVLAKETENVTIAYNGRNAVMRSAGFELTCRLIEGRYPNYNSVIPKDNPNQATINREALIAALRRVLIFSNAVSSLIKVRLEDGKMTISSQDTDYAMSAEESLICDYSGTPMSIGFKGPFMLDLITNLQSEEIVLRLADASRAGIIVPALQNEGEEVLMLLMPMMLGE